MDKQRADKFDLLIKEALQDHEIPPVEDYWPFLEKSLNKSSFYKFGWKHFNIYNISIGLTIALFSIFYFIPQSKETKEHSIIAPKADSKTTTPYDTETNPSKKQKNNTSIRIEKKVSKETKKEITKQDPIVDSNPKLSDSLPLISPEKENLPNEQGSEKIKEEKPKPKKIIYVVQQDTIIEKDTVKVKRKRKK